MADSEPVTPTTSATGANTGNIVALHAEAKAERPSEKVIGFVKRHPVATAAAGLAIGAGVAALLPRRITRRVTNPALGLARSAGVSTVLFGKRAGEQLRDLGSRASTPAHDALDTIGSRAEKLGDFTASRLEKLAGAALAAASSFAHGSRQRAEKLENAAHEAPHKLVDLLEDLREKTKR